MDDGMNPDKVSVKVTPVAGATVFGASGVSPVDFVSLVVVGLLVLLFVAIGSGCGMVSADRASLVAGGTPNAAPAAAAPANPSSVPSGNSASNSASNTSGGSALDAPAQETASAATFSAARFASSAAKLFAPRPRFWQAALARPPRIRIQGDLVRIDDIRDFRYRSEKDFDARYASRTLSLNDVRTVDFVVVPFNETPSLAHTMLSFGFTNDRYLTVSVEARLEEGQKYNPLIGAFGHYGLIYVIAEERDVIPLRTEHRDCDVYVYRTIARPASVRRLLLDVLNRARKLEKLPESYDTLFNNCTTNIIRHVNVLFPGTVPIDYRAVLPGMTDQLAFDLGLLKTDVSFAETKQRARVTERVPQHLDAADFSKRIREPQ